VLVFALYYGCDTKPKAQQELERSRALSAESTGEESIKAAALQRLSPANTAEIQQLEQQLNDAVLDTARASALKSLSSRWYNLEEPAMAGIYAQRVAELENTEESWSIAGTTFSICTQRANDDQIRDFCSGRAIQSFEAAASLDPGNLRHKVNLALVYTENPPENNPMRGIQMLLELNQSNPDNVYILNNLGRLSIQTGQYERAIERLTKVLELESDNRRAICLLANAYNGKGDQQQAAVYRQRCNEMNN